MNKLLFLFLAAFILSSCSDDFSESSELFDEINGEQASKPQLRSYDEVAEIANYASAKFGYGKSRSQNQNDLKINCVTTKSLSRTNGDTLLYVVNYGEDSGFAIISAKNDHEGLLAFSENGTYTPGEKFKNPGMEMMMKNAIAYSLRPGDIVPPTLPENPKMMEWVLDTTSIDVEPRLKVAWGTDYLGKDGFPDNNVTCGPIAVAQALSYIKQPSSIALTHKDNSILTLDWESIIADKFLSHPQRNLFGQEIAYRMGTFTSNGHSSDITDCRNVIEQLASGRTSEPVNYEPAIKAIKDNGVMIVSATTTDELTTDGNNGHTFVIDGGHYLFITETTYIVTYLSGTNSVLSREFKGTEILRYEYYFHINWGWSGINNGYFNAKLLAPHYGIEYDSDRVVTDGNSYDGNYQYNQWYMLVK